MLKKRNAQGITIRVLIIAAIALVVLIVLIAIFTGRLGVFGEGVRSLGNPALTCKDGQGGEIVEVDELVNGECPGGRMQIASRDSVIEGNKCCIKPSEELVEKQEIKKEEKKIKKCSEIAGFVCGNCRFDLRHKDRPPGCDDEDRPYCCSDLR